MRSAWRAVGRLAWLVGQHLDALDVEVWKPVQARDEQAGVVERAARETTRIHDNPRLDGGQRAVLLSAGLHLHDEPGRRGRRDELLATGQDQSDRPTGLLRQVGGDRLDNRLNLGAEAAANLHRHDLDLALWNAEDAAQLAADGELPLGGDVERQPVLRIPDRDRGPRLHVALVDVTDAVGLLDDHVGSGEASIDVSPLVM